MELSIWSLLKRVFSHRKPVVAKHRSPTNERSPRKKHVNTELENYFSDLGKE
jgi:hypothetical protein